MKIFISADIEGCAGLSFTDETHKNESVYQRYAEEMTNEVVAVCEAAHAAGAPPLSLAHCCSNGGFRAANSSRETS